MTDKFQQARRELFEAWTKSEHGDLTRRQDVEYFDDLTHGAWLGFNAALDLAVIELPEPHSTNGGDCVVDYEETRAALAAAPVQQVSVPDVLREAIKWADHLCFECGALVQTRAPSVHVYNKTFEAVQAAKAMLAADPAQPGSAKGGDYD